MDKHLLHGFKLNPCPNNLILNDLVPGVFILQTFDTRNELYTQILYTQFYIQTHATIRTQFTTFIYKCLGTVNFSDIKMFSV